MSVDSECATWSVSNIDELCDDCVGGWSKEGEQKHEPETVLNITEALCSQECYIALLCAQHWQVWWKAHWELVLGTVLSETYDFD